MKLLTLSIGLLLSCLVYGQQDNLSLWYSKPAQKKDSDNSWLTLLGTIAAIIVGLYNRSFFMGGGVLFGAACLVALLEKGPAIILIICIPATIALFYFGNKELESREKK